MTSPEPSMGDRVFMKRTVEAAIRIGVIAGLILWCFIIARPFLIPIVWGAIIAVAIFHGYERLQTALGGRRVTAAVLVSFLMLVLLVLPSVLLGNSLVSGARNVVNSFQSGELYIPPPPGSVAQLATDWRAHRESLESGIPKPRGGAASSQSPTKGLRGLAPKCRCWSRTCAPAVRAGDSHRRSLSRQFWNCRPHDAGRRETPRGRAWAGVRGRCREDRAECG